MGDTEGAKWDDNTNNTHKRYWRWSSIEVEICMDQPDKVAPILLAFAPENLVSRDGFGSPVPRQPTHIHTQAESGACLRGIPPEFCGGVHSFI